MRVIHLVLAAALAGAACGRAPARQPAAPAPRVTGGKGPVTPLARSAPRADLACDTATVGGSIRGRVLFEPTGGPVRSHGATIRKIGSDADTAQPMDFNHSQWCMAVTDSTGRFRFARVPPGRWEVRLANGGYHRTAAMPVTVRADSVSEVEFMLRAENMVADCLERPACQDLLVPPPRLAGADDSTRLQLAGYAIAIAFAAGGRGPTPVACVAGATPAVFGVLRQRYAFVVPDSACERPSMSSFLPGPKHMVEHVSGRNAFLVGPSRIELNGDTAIVHSSYYVDPLWALGWRCRFVRAEGEWQPLRCNTEWIS